MMIKQEPPFGVELQDTGDELYIKRLWFYWTSIPIGLFALGWIGLTLCRNIQHLFTVCNFLFLGLGLFALYISVLSLTNSTEIVIDHQKMAITHGPLPSLTRNETIPIKSIRQLVLTKVRMSGNITGSSTYWDLEFVDRFGKKRQIISAVPDWNQAQFIKDTIERFLDRVQNCEVTNG